MKNTITAVAATLAATALLSSCSTGPDGERMTLGERWQAMAARQDAAARAFVDTGSMRDNPLPSGGPGAQERSTFGSGGW